MTRACWGASMWEAVLISQKEWRGSTCRLRCDAVAVTVPVHPGDDMGMPVEDGDQLVARVPRLVRVARVGREVGHHVRWVVAEHEDVSAPGRDELLLEPVQLAGTERPVCAAGLVGRVEADGKDLLRQQLRVVEAGAVVVRVVPVTGGTRTREPGLAQRLDVLRPGERRAARVGWTALVWPRAAIASIRRPTPPTPRSGWSRGVLAPSLAASRSASSEPAENTLRSPAHHSAVASWCSSVPRAAPSWLPIVSSQGTSSPGEANGLVAAASNPGTTGKP